MKNIIIAVLSIAVLVQSFRILKMKDVDQSRQMAQVAEFKPYIKAGENIYYFNRTNDEAYVLMRGLNSVTNHNYEYHGNP